MNKLLFRFGYLSFQFAHVSDRITEDEMYYGPNLLSFPAWDRTSSISSSARIRPIVPSRQLFSVNWLPTLPWDNLELIKKGTGCQL